MGSIREERSNLVCQQKVTTKKTGKERTLSCLMLWHPPDESERGIRVQNVTPKYATLADYFEIKALEKEWVKKDTLTLFVPLKAGDKFSM